MATAARAEQPTTPEGAKHPERYVCVETFGCQMNVYDTERIYQVLEPYNYKRTEDPARADLIILNTCSVREKAEHKVLSRLGRLAPLKDHNDELVLSVAGCVAQQEGEALLAKVPYVDLVLGPDAIATLPRLLDRVREGRERVSETGFIKRKDYEFIEGRPRAEHNGTEYVTVMKGCDKVCSFCIVPFTRGREVSKPADMVVDEVRRLVDAGVKEVTLLGQNVNSYGKDPAGDGGIRFSDLLRRVDAVEGLERLRFTTSYPTDCTDDLIDCFGDLRTLCEFFHLPVQSGSDRVLTAMRRHYDRALYLGRIERLRARCPGIAIATDLIVGFPGETEEDFEATLELVREVRFEWIFGFKYSQRPGTRAAQLPDDVPEREKKARLARVQDLQRRILDEKLASYLGRTVEVLLEGPSRTTTRPEQPGEWQLTGRTRTNVVVNVPVPRGEFWTQRWIGALARVRVDGVRAHSLYGILI